MAGNKNQKQEYKVRRRWVTENGAYKAGSFVSLTRNEALLAKDFLFEIGEISSSQTDETAPTQGNDEPIETKTPEVIEEAAPQEQKQEAPQQSIASAFGSVANKIFGGSTPSVEAPAEGVILETQTEEKAPDVLDS